MSDTTNSPEPRTPRQDPPRRRFFRRAAIATLVAGVATGIGLNAFAAGGGHRGWHRAGFLGASLDPAQLDEHVDRMLKHFYVEIDATEAQRARLGPIVKQAAKDLLPVHERLHEARKQGLGLLTAASLDRGALERLRADQIQAADAASQRLTQALADVADVLTPEQRKALAERLQRRRGWRHG